MFTKCGRVVTYLDRFLPIRSNDPLITWSCKITWQTKIIISVSTTTVSMTIKLDRMVTYLDGLLPIKSHYLWSCGLSRLRDKLKSLYLHYHSGYLSHYISKTTKLGRMINNLDTLLPIKSHDPLITWSCDITRQTKTSISPVSACLWPPNLTGW